MYEKASVAGFSLHTKITQGDQVVIFKKKGVIFLLYICAERYVTGKQLQAYFRNNNTCSVKNKKLLSPIVDSSGQKKKISKVE